MNITRRDMLKSSAALAIPFLPMKSVRSDELPIDEKYYVVWKSHCATHPFRPIVAVRIDGPFRDAMPLSLMLIDRPVFGFESNSGVLQRVEWKNGDEYATGYIGFYSGHAMLKCYCEKTGASPLFHVNDIYESYHFDEFTFTPIMPE